MSTGSTDHYEVFAKQPVPGSVYEFFVTSFQMIDDDPSPPLALGPIDITEDMAPQYRAWAIRQNPLLLEREEGKRRWIHGLLIDAGIGQSKIDDPSPGMQRLLEELDAGRLAMDYLLDQHCAGRNPAVKRASPHVRVLAAAYFFSGSSPTAAARFLNAGGGRRGLTRDHVSRGLRAFLLRQLGTPSLAFDCEIYLTLNNWLTLDWLRLEAGKHPKLKRYKGADLALAIDRDFDLLLKLDRAAETLREHGRLVPFVRSAA